MLNIIIQQRKVKNLVSTFFLNHKKYKMCDGYNYTIHKKEKNSMYNFHKQIIEKFSNVLSLMYKYG